MSDPVAEMKAAIEAELKAREFREHGEWPTTIPPAYPANESRWEDRYAAAFAAKEVERREDELLAEIDRCKIEHATEAKRLLGIIGELRPKLYEAEQALLRDRCARLPRSPDMGERTR